jgi:hypothetical protein
MNKRVQRVMDLYKTFILSFRLLNYMEGRYDHVSFRVNIKSYDYKRGKLLLYFTYTTDYQTHGFIGVDPQVVAAVQVYLFHKMKRFANTEPLVLPICVHE